MLQRIKNWFRKRPAHEVMYDDLVRYSKLTGIQLVGPKGHLASPRRIGKAVGQHVGNKFKGAS